MAIFAKSFPMAKTKQVEGQLNLPIINNVRNLQNIELLKRAMLYHCATRLSSILRRASRNLNI